MDKRKGFARQPVSLKEWQEMFGAIYKEKDERDYSPADLLLHIEEEAAKIDEGVRKESNLEIDKAIPRFFCWFLSFCNRVDIDLEETTWKKYQGICPYCGREDNCMCITEGKKPSQWFENPEGKIPASLKEWQEMFRKIYGKINKIAWLVQIWLHIHEELGEASREFRLKEVLKFQGELADSFAWLIAFCNKLNIDLSEIIWKTYPGRCDVCGKEKCECWPV